MAKKVVATLKAKDKVIPMAKVIYCTKNQKSGAYGFKEEIILAEKAQEFIQQKLKSN